VRFACTDLPVPQLHGVLRAVALKQGFVNDRVFEKWSTVPKAQEIKMLFAAYWVGSYTEREWLREHTEKSRADTQRHDTKIKRPSGQRDANGEFVRF